METVLNKANNWETQTILINISDFSDSLAAIDSTAD